MPNSCILNLPSDLAEFLIERESAYKSQLEKLSLFNVEITASWSLEQKKRFAAVFYHMRGHFIDFMWYLANFSNDKIKKIVLYNIQEELGLGAKLSHEELYALFAKECQVDIHDEVINETNYLSFVKDFNKEHLKWLSQHDTDEKLAAFSAYERLDNLDYHYLSKFAGSLKLSKIAMTFFKAHIHVEHFESTLENLIPIWHSAKDKVKKSFDFIYTHQYKIWQQLSAMMEE